MRSYLFKFTKTDYVDERQCFDQTIAYFFATLIYTMLYVHSVLLYFKYHLFIHKNNYSWLHSEYKLMSIQKFLQCWSDVTNIIFIFFIIIITVYCPVWVISSCFCSRPIPYCFYSSSVSLVLPTILNLFLIHILSLLHIIPPLSFCYIQSRVVNIPFSLMICPILFSSSSGLYSKCFPLLWLKNIEVSYHLISLYYKTYDILVKMNHFQI